MYRRSIRKDQLSGPLIQLDLVPNPKRFRLDHVVALRLQGGFKDRLLKILLSMRPHSAAAHIDPQIRINRHSRPVPPQPVKKVPVSGWRMIQIAKISAHMQTANPCRLRDQYQRIGHTQNGQQICEVTRDLVKPRICVQKEDRHISRQPLGHSKPPNGLRDDMAKLRSDHTAKDGLAAKFCRFRSKVRNADWGRATVPVDGPAMRGDQVLRSPYSNPPQCSA